MGLPCAVLHLWHPLLITDLVFGLNVGAEGEEQNDLLEVSAPGSADEFLGRLGLQPLK